MNVELTGELEQLVQSKVDAGHYRSVEEVVSDALRLLEHRDMLLTAHKDRIRQQIEEGWESAKRGDVVDGEEFMARMDAELEALERAERK
jgi:antitoxin ParD1/3/4